MAEAPDPDDDPLEPVEVLLNKALARRLDAYAAAHSLTRAEAILHTLEHALEVGKLTPQLHEKRSL